VRRFEAAKAQLSSAPLGLRGELAMMHGETRRLIEHGVDAIGTYALDSGKAEAKASKRELTHQAQELILSIEAAIATLDCRHEQPPVSRVKGPKSSLSEQPALSSDEQMVVVDAVPVAMGMVLEDVMVVDAEVPILAIDSFPLVDLSALHGTMVGI
tara:strand:+ start:142 stop:609 length:468 start_codon:yes stop_codon:yes gene_type:complete